MGPPTGFEFLPSCSLDTSILTPADLIAVGRGVLNAAPTSTNIPPNSVYTVTGATIIVGNLVVGASTVVVLAPGASLVVTGTVTLAANTSVVVQLNPNTAATGVSTVTLVSTQRGLIGTFAAVRSTFIAPTCKTADVVAPPTYGPLSATVDINVSTSGCGEGGGLSAGAIAGIVIGCVLVGAAIAVLIVWLAMRQQSRAKAAFVARETNLMRESALGEH